MALVNCPECHNQLSSKAESCPKCGHPLKKVQKSSSGCASGCLMIVIILAVLSVLGHFLNPSSSGVAKARTSYPTVRKETDSGITGKELVWIRRQKQNIKSTLRDPDSATFRNVIISRVIGPPVVLGEVNSKNGFGGSTGFQRFMVAEHIQAIEGIDMTHAEFTKAWNEMVP